MSTQEKKKEKKYIRRSGAKIMASLVVLLGSLSYIMILAVINGSLGFISAMGVTVFGAMGVAKALGEQIALSYGWIIGLTVGCGLIRGLLRYIEQYSNHYIAFRLLAAFRDKIFGALRVLCPAKLESKQKGSIIAMITSDIETLEVFYAHTISPICIAVLVSTTVFLFVGFVSSWYLALVALVGFLFIGIVVPLISSGRLKESGVKYRAEFSSFSAYFLDSIKGIKDIMLNNAGEEREEEVNKRSDVLLKETKKMKHNITRAGAAIELTVSAFILAALAVGIVLVRNDMLSLGRMIIGMVTVFSSFGPVIAVGGLPGNLTQTFASGDRVLNLLAEKPAVEEVKNGKNFDYENLNVEDLSFSYDGQTEVLNDVKMHAEKGEIIGIVGESGCGKSTFLRCLNRMNDLVEGCRVEGKVILDGEDIYDKRVDTTLLRKKVGMVFQQPNPFPMSIYDNIAYGPRLHGIKNKKELDEIVERSLQGAAIFEEVKDRLHKSALGLSGGQQQRLCIARALAVQPEVLLMDEPTNGLDIPAKACFRRVVARQMREDRTIVISTHQVRDVDALLDHVAVVDHSKILLNASTADITST